MPCLRKVYRKLMYSANQNLGYREVGGDLVLLTERQDDFARAIARGVTDYT